MPTDNTATFVSQVNALRNLVNVIGGHLDKTLVDSVKFRDNKLNLQSIVFTKIYIFLTIADYIGVMKTHRYGLETMSTSL